MAVFWPMFTDGLAMDGPPFDACNTNDFLVCGVMNADDSATVSCHDI